jgi:hypothetical protein
MVQEKVTRQELREMHIGQTRIFQLVNRKKIASARVTAAHLKNEEGLVFEVNPDWESSAVSIKRIK